MSECQHKQKRGGEKQRNKRQEEKQKTPSLGGAIKAPLASTQARSQIRQSARQLCFSLSPSLPPLPLSSSISDFSVYRLARVTLSPLGDCSGVEGGRSGGGAGVIPPMPARTPACYPDGRGGGASMPSLVLPDGRRRWRWWLGSAVLPALIHPRGYRMEGKQTQGCQQHSRGGERGARKRLWRHEGTHMPTLTHTHTHMQTQTNTHTHTHTHTHKSKPCLSEYCFSWLSLSPNYFHLARITMDSQPITILFLPPSLEGLCVTRNIKH